MGKVYERPRLQVAAIKLGAYGDYENGLPEEGLGDRFGLTR
jgi:hypothetical protein